MVVPSIFGLCRITWVHVSIAHPHNLTTDPTSSPHPSPSPPGTWRRSSPASGARRFQGPRAHHQAVAYALVARVASPQPAIHHAIHRALHRLGQRLRAGAAHLPTGTGALVLGTGTAPRLDRGSGLRHRHLHAPVRNHRPPGAPNAVLLAMARRKGAWVSGWRSRAGSAAPRVRTRCSTGPVP